MMGVETYTKFHCLFHFLCFLIAFGLAFRCLLKFLENDNLSSVNYKKFHKNEYHIYPSMSWCIINPFLGQKLKTYGHDVNITSYSDFLRGLYWDERMLAINFDSVTPSLADNLLGIWMGFHDKTVYTYDHASNISYPKEWFPYFYISFRSAIRKCFTFDIPFMKNKQIHGFGLRVKNSFFPRGVRPTALDKDKFSVYFHYPGQRFTSIYTIKYDWEPKSNKSRSYYMRFELKDVEVNRHRIRPQEPCIEDWKKYDEMIMDGIMLKAGCRPPHWDTAHNLSMCSKSEQMAHFDDQPSSTILEAFGPPCTAIENLHYRYYEQENFMEGNFLLHLQYR